MISAHWATEFRFKTSKGREDAHASYAYAFKGSIHPHGQSLQSKNTLALSRLWWRVNEEKSTNSFICTCFFIPSFSLTFLVMQQSASEKERGRSGQFTKRKYTYTLTHYTYTDLPNFTHKKTAFLGINILRGVTLLSFFERGLEYVGWPVLPWEHSSFNFQPRRHFLSLLPTLLILMLQTASIPN